MLRDFRGIYIPLATPFQEDGEVNENELRRLVQATAPYVDGFIVNGTTSDFPLLSLAERYATLKAVVDEVGGKKRVIAGVGAISTAEAVDLTRHAQEAGADAVLVVKPYYVRPTPTGLQAHFATIAAATPDFPILLYNFPKMMGQEIPVDVVRTLTETTTNVIGMKDSSGQLPYTLAVMEETPATFNMLVGHGALLLPAVAMGAAGGILAAANLIPHVYCKMYAAALSNAWDHARALQSRLYPIAQLVATYGSLAVRAGLQLLGFAMGAPRAPLSQEGVPTAAEVQVLQRTLEDLREV